MTQFYNQRNFLTALSVALFGWGAFAQGTLPISHDEASNYAEGEFESHISHGAGLVPWQFLSGTSETSGYAMGSSTEAGLGNVNTDDKAFMLFGYDGMGVSIARYFRGTGSIADPGDARSYLLPGQVFSIRIAIGNRNGYKGINITSDDGSDRLATFAVDGDNYRFGDPDDATFVSVNDSFEFDPESVFTVECYQLTDNTCRITLTRGTTIVSTAVKPGQIGGFSMYEGSTWSADPLNRLYFNNLLLERRCPDITTWNGTGWDNGTPNLTKQGIVASGTLTISEDTEMCTLYVLGTAQVVVESGINLTVANTIHIDETASLIVENNANLIQIDNVQNTGDATIIRDSSPIRRLDYTLWSSPVTGQNLFGFSKHTIPNRFYTYNSATNAYSVVPDLGPESTTEFAKGRGYLIRVSNNHPEVPTIWTGTFKGIPNSGTVSVPLNTSNDPAFRYNLIGNPYPSAISIERFVDRNSLVITGQLWFWRKQNNPDASSYCTVTADGGYVGNADLEENELYDPQGVIRTGQGFFVEALSASPGNVVFNNSLRDSDTSNTFFRSNMSGEVEKNRFWLDIKKDNAIISQMLVNYMTGATEGIDYRIDGKAMDGDGLLGLYSIAEGTNLTIQGRGLPFADTDIVPLGMRADQAGTYKIALNRFDGLFTGQNIYLKDNYFGTTHNLKDGMYEFATEAGTFNDRFEVVYAETLGTNTPETNNNSVVVYGQAGSININSGVSGINSIDIYDVRGRLLLHQSGLNVTETSISSIQPQQQMLIVQVTTKDGAKISKKIIF